MPAARAVAAISLRGMAPSFRGAYCCYTATGRQVPARAGTAPVRRVGDGERSRLAEAAFQVAIDVAFAGVNFIDVMALRAIRDTPPLGRTSWARRSQAPAGTNGTRALSRECPDSGCEPGARSPTASRRRGRRPVR